MLEIPNYLKPLYNRHPNEPSGDFFPNFRKKTKSLIDRIQLCYMDQRLSEEKRTECIKNRASDLYDYLIKHESDLENEHQRFAQANGQFYRLSDPFIDTHDDLLYNLNEFALDYVEYADGGAQMDKKLILNMFKKVKRIGPNQYMALCPAHDDHDPNLSIKFTDDNALLHCFAGCTCQEILNRISND